MKSIRHHHEKKLGNQKQNLLSILDFAKTYEEADEYLQAHIESIIEENIEEDMEANPEAVNYYKETLAYEPAENVFCFL